MNNARVTDASENGCEGIDISSLKGIAEMTTRSREFVVTKKAGTAQTEVYGGGGAWVATFTQGARTVALAGTERTFSETTSSAVVISKIHVRLLPAPFTGSVNRQWLRPAISDSSPDLLDMSLQYISGAPALYDSAGLQIAGHAKYGVLLANGKRDEGADFNDYLGVTWEYLGRRDAPEPDQLHCLDCSGFVRMLFGYRAGMNMTLSPAPGQLPRRAFQMYEYGPGVLIQGSGSQVKTLDAIQPGDLVFFDAEPNEATGQIDHVGVFLGTDTNGKHRFISSRQKANGPTLGDVGGPSILDGTGYYAKAFRGIRRL
ncbi:NlpC/P60 family protein [Arthrobacter sp. Cr_A7]|uniref:C40 family peptidase n=1 Tax=Arthrobacter sp. Cr_A7 TaxID=3031017 RepID=UPI0023D9C430|nr:NlpC/P60 family protein [Arthrobacter sp. Cr_A7]MDF2049535.1 NlpC/P60 family protein [Arthrobacter sp. Cr_A7]